MFLVIGDGTGRGRHARIVTGVQASRLDVLRAELGGGYPYAGHHRGDGETGPRGIPVSMMIPCQILGRADLEGMIPVRGDGDLGQVRD